MALTDLINKMVRPIALTGLLYSSCGDTTNYYGGNRGNNSNSCNDWERRLCTCYDVVCPGVFEASKFTLKECDQYCSRNSNENECIFYRCLMEAEFCLDANNPDTCQGETDSKVKNCMESYGLVSSCN